MMPDFLHQFRKLFIPTFLLVGVAEAAAEMDGKMLYTMNCSACHQLDKMQGGPSLIEVASLYRGKEDAFVKWAQNPNPHKRKNLAQMPAMAHVAEGDLRKIYGHVMTLTKGRTYKPEKKEKTDPFPNTLAERPVVQRTFVPGMGPAAIAVGIDEKWSYAFDAGQSRLRLIWQDGLLDNWPYWKGNGNSFAKIRGEILLKEKTSPLPFGEDEESKFLGYQLVDGLPTLRYRRGGTVVEERLWVEEGSLLRSFDLANAPSAFALTLTAPKGHRITANQGQLADGKLAVTDFTNPLILTYAPLKK